MSSYVQDFPIACKEIDGLSLCYRHAGEGKPVVLLHGWGCDSTTMERLHRHLAERFSAYSVDFPGFGETPEPPEAWGTDRYADLIERWLQAMGIDAPILVGHSFGGRVAIRLANRIKVSKLVLTGGAGLKPKRPASYYAKVYAYKSLKAVMSLPGLNVFKEQALEAWRGKAGSDDYQKASPVMRDTLVKTVNEDLFDLLPGVKAPTLLVWGENDTATPLEHAKTMERHIPDAGLVVFKGAGHYAFLEQHARFAAILDEFLKHEAKAA